MQKLETLLAQKAELRAREAELERQIAQAQREERESAISQVRSLMSQHVLTIKDIISGKAEPKARLDAAAKEIIANIAKG